MGCEPLGCTRPLDICTCYIIHLNISSKAHEATSNVETFLGSNCTVSNSFFSPRIPSSHIFHRLQEKPAAAPLPPVAPRVPPSVPEPAEPAPAPFTNGDPDLTDDGWEDPITVQPPTWDDEQQVKPPPEVAWSSPVQTQSDVQDETLAPLPEEEPAPEISAPVLSEPVPTPQQPAEEPVTAPTPSKSPVSVPPRSSTASHRSATKYKVIDQAVVMPTSSFNPGLEKVGMQFGSLSLGGDVIEPSPLVIISLD